MDKELLMSFWQQMSFEKGCPPLDSKAVEHIINQWETFKDEYYEGPCPVIAFTEKELIAASYKAVEFTNQKRNKFDLSHIYIQPVTGTSSVEYEATIYAKP